MIRSIPVGLGLLCEIIQTLLHHALLLLQVLVLFGNLEPALIQKVLFRRLRDHQLGVAAVLEVATSFHVAEESFAEALEVLLHLLDQLN